jgi:hypothetical protein
MGNLEMFQVPEVQGNSSVEHAFTCTPWFQNIPYSTGGIKVRTCSKSSMFQRWRGILGSQGTVRLSLHLMILI